MLRFFKDFCLYGLVGLLGKVVALFLLPVYTNILSKEEYGVMTLIIACRGIIDLVSNLNLHSGITRDYYEDGIDRKRLVSTGFFSILGLSLFILINLLLTRRFWIESVLSLDPGYSMAVVLMMLSMPVASLQSYFAIITRFKKKALLFSVGEFIGLVIRIGTALLCVVHFRIGIIGIFLGDLLALTFCVIFYAFINKELLAITFDWAYLRRALLFALPTLPAILAGWLDTSVGQIMISRSISVSDLGVYSLALSITSVFTFLTGALQNVWLPYLYENYKLDSFQQRVSDLFSLIMVAIIVISVILSLFSREIILLLSNEGYLAATKYITLLTIPAVLYLLFPIASSGISISRDTKHIGIAYIIGTSVNLLLLFFAIREFGVIAVPVCLSLSRLTSYVYMYVVSNKCFRFDLPNWMVALFLSAMIALAFLNDCDLKFAMRSAIAAILVLPLVMWIWAKFDVHAMLLKINVKKGVDSQQ